MNKSNRQGILAEAKALSHFIKEEYEVYTQFSGKSPIDMIVEKNGKLSRVEVKSTRTRTKYNTGWVVQLKSTLPNKNKKNKIINFDNKSCDILVIYIEPLDKIIIKKSKEIKVVGALAILDKDLEG